MPSRPRRPSRAPSPHGFGSSLLLAVVAIALTGVAATPAAGGPLQVTDRVVGASSVHIVKNLSVTTS